MIMSKKGLSLWISMLTTVLFSLTAQAEKQKLSFKYTYNEPAVSAYKLNPGDRAEHELGLELLPATVTSTNPEWNDIKVMDYVYSDSVAGKGTGGGYATELHKDGGKTFWHFHGSHSTTVKEGGAWEVTFTGTGEGLGGTGKFEKFKGTATYLCKATPETTICDVDSEVEY